MKLKIISYLLITLIVASCGQISISIEPTATPSMALPDLVVVSINVAMVDANGRCVDGYQLFTSILNQGASAAEGVAAVEMSTGHTFIIGRLEAGQKMDLQIPAASANGTYLVNVDPQNVIAESNETNNNLSYLLPTPTPYAGCAPVPALDATPAPVPTLPPPSAASSLDGLIYADMNRAVIGEVPNFGNPFDILQGTSARFTQEGRYALFDRSGDLFLAEPMDNPGGNITNTPDLFETAPQWWPANPSTIVFNVVGVNDAQTKGWTHSVLGYPAMMNRNGSDYVTLGDVPSFTKPALSPDGKTIAYDTSGLPILYEIGSVERTFDPCIYGYMDTPQNGKFFTSPSFSPDGRWLTWWVSQDESVPQRTFSLVMFDLVGMTNTTLHSYPALGGTLGWLSNPIWSPGGQWIAFQTNGEVTPRGDLWIIHRDGNIGQRFGLAADPVWSPDSQHVAYVQWQPQTSGLPSNLTIIDVPSWNIQQTDLPAGSIPLHWIPRNSQ